MSTPTYLEQIRQLVELQKVDDEIFAVRQEMERAPREVADLRQKFEVSEAQRNKILDKLTHLQEQQKRIALEIDDDSARIKKSKNKLMQVEDARSYHAMMREMDSMEKINRSREEEKVVLLEELQLQNDALAELDRTHSTLQAELEVKEEGLQEKLAICHSPRANDATIRQALIDRFAPGTPNKGKGTKKEPGWFYGFRADIWQAYAVGVTWADLNRT